MHPNRIQEIDIAKGAAILAVLLIHVTGPSLREFSPDSTIYAAYEIINRMMQFAVPVFLMISTILPTMRLNNRQTVDWREFYHKRWNQVVIPYLVWTTIYIIVVRFALLGEANYLSLKHWAFWYMFGKGYYHLYFLSLLVQMYLFFPLLHRFWLRVQPGFTTCILVFGTCQVAFYWFNRLYIYQYFPYPGSLVFSYLFPIGVGFWMGWNLEKWPAWWKAWRPAVIATALASGAAYVYLHMIWVLNDAPISTFNYQIAWYLYVTSIGLIMIFAARRITTGTNTLTAVLRRALLQTGEKSFGIYLLHPFFLLLWIRAWSPDGAPLIQLCLWGGLVFILACSRATVELLHKTRLSRILFGNR